MVGKKEAVMELTASLPILYVYLHFHRQTDRLRFIS